MLLKIILRSSINVIYVQFAIKCTLHCTHLKSIHNLEKKISLSVSNFMNKNWRYLNKQVNVNTVDTFLNWKHKLPLLNKDLRLLMVFWLHKHFKHTLKFGSKNLYQSPVTVPRLLSLYYKKKNTKKDWKNSIFSFFLQWSLL